MSDTPIIDAIRAVVAQNPEAAAETLADARAQFDALDPEQQDEVRSMLQDMIDNTAELPEADRQAIADQIRERFGL